MSRFQHPSYHGRRNRTTKTQDDEHPATPEPATKYSLPLRYAQRACCCLAPPAVIAVIPSAGDRVAPTELFLCGHHYRQSRRALAASEITLLDLAGNPLTAQLWPEAAAQLGDRLDRCEEPG
jgi:hypothetical protein